MSAEVRLPFELRAPRVGLLIATFGALVLGGAFAAVLLFGVEGGPDAQLTGGAKVLLWVMLAVTAFLAVVFGRWAIEPPVVFRMTTVGFEYSPAGVSTGLIRWSDIRSLDDVEVMVQAGRRPARERAIAVMLRNPEAYVEGQARPLAPLFKLREAMSGTPLLIRPADLGPHGERVLGTMRRLVQEAAGG